MGYLVYSFCGISTAPVTITHLDVTNENMIEFYGPEHQFFIMSKKSEGFEKSDNL
jgi:hypothetical protein